MQNGYENRNKEELISTIYELKNKYEDIRFQYEELRRLVFGVKSERFVSNLDPSQLRLLDISVSNPVDKIEKRPSPSSTNIKKTGVEKAKPKRTRISKKLKRIDEVIEPQEDVSGLKKIGEVVTEMLDFRPAVLHVKRYIRPKYVDPNNEDKGVIIGKLPDFPIAKGKAGSGLISKVIIDKYVDHIPCYRQEKIYNRYDERISRSTLCGWISQSADLMTPLYESLKKEVLSSGYIQMDESPIPVLTKNKKGSTHRGYMWVYQAVNNNQVIFDYQPSKEGKVATQILKNYKGYLQTDGYAAYEIFKTKKKIKVLHCWAHARRYFHRAQQNDRVRAEYVLGKIRELYMLEDMIKKDCPEMDPHHIQDVRHRYAVPILHELENWLHENLHQVRPKSAIGKAIRYTLKRYKELQTYTKDGRLNIDNNPVENSIRPLALGRKNYLFAGSHEGAKRAAIMYSFLGTCKLREVNPFFWLKSTLDNIGTYPVKKISDLLP